MTGMCDDLRSLTYYPLKRKELWKIPQGRMILTTIGIKAKRKGKAAVTATAVATKAEAVETKVADVVATAKQFS
jgi:hypothetical protein